MIQQKLIGGLTFFLALILVGGWMFMYTYYDLSEILSDEPFDLFIGVYRLAVDGLLGLACGALLYKGVKAGYILGLWIWGGAALLHLYEIILLMFSEGFNPQVNLEQYAILIDIAACIAGLFVIKWLYEDFNKEPSEQLVDL